MIDRNDIIEEQLLRENIRKAIEIVKKRRSEGEGHIRTIIRSLLKEVAETPRYEYNSLMQLHKLMLRDFGSKSGDSNPVFKEGFIDLVSSAEDREVFVEFILDFSEDLMNRIDAGEDLESIKKGEKEEKQPEEEEEDDTLTVSIGEIPGGDLDAQSDEELDEELDDEFTLGEDGSLEQEANAELKNYSQKVFNSLAANIESFYTNFPNPNKLIEDDVIIDTRENELLPKSERRYKVHPGRTITERDLFKIFYRINVLSWAGRYNEEYFSDVPRADIELDPVDSEPSFNF
jgi:hypothetical protein